MVRSLILPLLAVLLCAAGGASAQNHIVVTKTLVSNSAHRECMSLSDRQLLRFWYRAEAPLEFDIQFIKGEDMTYPLRQQKQAVGSGLYTPKEAGDYCMVWTNLSKQPVLFRFELARLARQ